MLSQSVSQLFHGPAPLLACDRSSFTTPTLQEIWLKECAKGWELIIEEPLEEAD